jgi:hypothetical protein
MTPKNNKLHAPMRKNARLMRVRSFVVIRPIPPPVVDRTIGELSSLERAGEVLRYSLLRAEYWLSPSGLLRALLRMNLQVSVMIGMPALIVGPVILLCLEGVAAASALLAATAANLAALSISLIVAVIGSALLTALLRMLVRRK